MAQKKKPVHRELMELAIEEMKRSIDEPRENGKATPKVGAVIRKPDGTVETAFRGELRYGEHAEYTLLERKCMNENLEGSILFSTLEPCLKRSPPKIECARRTVLARIKEVYVGIEDEDPTVAGKGIEYLIRNGIIVHMFDRDLQKQITKINKEYSSQARERVKEEMQDLKLSKFEGPIRAVTLEDLSSEALKYYRTKSAIKYSVGSGEFSRILEQQGLLQKKGNKRIPSGFGLMLFGKQPRNAIPQAALLAKVEAADGSTTRKEFGQAMVLIPGLLEDWLLKTLPHFIDRSRMERRELVNLPFEMIREAVVNALIHRDYSLQGMKCHLAIDADTFIIKSPGGPVKPITLEQMQSFTAPMKSRNPILHYVFFRIGLAEEQGFGLTSLKEGAEKLGLPLPSFSMENDYLVLTIYRSKKAATKMLTTEVLSNLNKGEQEGWRWLSTKKSINSKEYAFGLNIPIRTARRQLKHLTNIGLLRRIGDGPATRYEVIRGFSSRP